MSMKKTYAGEKALKSYTSKIKFQSTLVFIFCVILTLISLFPIYLLIVSATRSNTQLVTGVSLLPSSYLISNLKGLFSWTSVDMIAGFKNSLIVAVGATFLAVFCSALTAYGLVVYDFKLKDISYSFILAVMMVPVQVSGVGFLKFMYSLDLDNSFIPLIIPAAAAPAVVFFIRQYMKSSFPLEIVEAARIDGSGEFRTFLTIGIPMIKPALAVQFIFQFIYQWNNYFTPSVILNKLKLKTLPLMIKALGSNALDTDYGIIFAGIAFSIVPLVIIYLLLSRYIIAGVALGGVKE